MALSILAALLDGANVPHVNANVSSVTSILTVVYGLAATLAVIFVVIGGIRYVLSGGDPGHVKQAKDSIAYALIGLVLVLVAFAVTQFFVKRVDGSNVSNLLGSFLSLLFYALGIFAVIMLIIGGLRFVTSNGDPSQVTSAKNTILYAVVGIIISVAAVLLVNFVISAL